MSEQQKQQLLAGGQLISLITAAKYTPYTAEYLSLLARKNQLAAVKISRDWLTTKEAVITYTAAQKKKHYKLFQRFGIVDDEMVEEGGQK